MNKLKSYHKVATNYMAVTLRPAVAPFFARMKRTKRAEKAKKVARHEMAAEAMRDPLFMRFPVQDQILFAKRLSMILRSGMPIMEGLSMLHVETRSRSAAHIYKSLLNDVQRGQALSAGVQKFERFFGEYCVNIIRVGEASGTLNENLEYLAEELKKKQALRRKVVGALVYPAVIVVATVAIVVMLTIYIFPKIIPIFAGVKAQLPLSTRILIVLSDFLAARGLYLLGVISLLTIGFFILVRYVPKFHLFIDKILVRLPLFGKLSKYYNLSNITRTLSILLRSDVRIIQAMDLVSAATRNLAYRKELEISKERIMKGQKIAAQFKENQVLFPPLMTQMITVGESTGNLGGTLEYISQMYEDEINELTKNLTTLIEPVLMIVMGIIVGFIAVSIITPIYSITQSLTPH
jgi:type IV pilus assembly protein PilC